MKVAPSTVYEMIRNDFQYEERSPYKSVLDSEDEREIVIAAEEDRDLTAAEIARDKKINPKEVSKDTIERVLNKHGLKCRRKQIMQDLTEKNKDERYRLARRYRRWSKERMKKIFYSDESNICLK